MSAYKKALEAKRKEEQDKKHASFFRYKAKPRVEVKNKIKFLRVGERPQMSDSDFQRKFRRAAND